MIEITIRVRLVQKTVEITKVVTRLGEGGAIRQITMPDLTIIGP